MTINHEFIRKYTRRKRGHDYYSPCHYHVILRKAPHCLDFGSVKTNPAKAYGDEGFAFINYSKLGKIICGNIWDLPKEFKQLSMNQYCVMPDHVHIFLRVKERSDKHLGDFVSILKANIAKEFSHYSNKEILSSEIFEDNYTDKIVYLGRNFNVLRNYIRTNPDRLAVRKLFPKFFQRKEIFEIKGEKFESYGNHSLLEHPFIRALRIHRANSDELNFKIKESFLEHTAEGGVIISPFISKKEKYIRQLVERMGGKIIHIQKDPFREKFKPSEYYFNLCCSGRLLIIAPLKSYGEILTYNISSKMNDLAEFIANEGINFEPRSHTA